MNDNTRDYLMWKNGKGRYSEGGKYHGAKAPQEGGVLAPEYRATNAGNKNAQAMYRSHNVEPEALETDAIQFSPPRMQADPFDKSTKAKKAGAIETEMPEPMMQDTEAQDVFTPIGCFIEGEAAGSVQ